MGRCEGVLENQTLVCFYWIQPKLLLSPIISCEITCLQKERKKKGLTSVDVDEVEEGDEEEGEETEFEGVKENTEFGRHEKMSLPFSELFCRFCEGELSKGKNKGERKEQVNKKRLLVQNESKQTP